MAGYKEMLRLIRSESKDRLDGMRVPVVKMPKPTARQRAWIREWAQIDRRRTTLKKRLTKAGLAIETSHRGKVHVTLDYAWQRKQQEHWNTEHARRRQLHMAMIRTAHLDLMTLEPARAQVYLRRLRSRLAKL